MVSALRSRRVSNSLEAANQVKPLPLFGEERELRMRTENSAVSVNRNRMSLPIRENSRIFELQNNRLYKLRPLETTKHTKSENYDRNIRRRVSTNVLRTQYTQKHFVKSTAIEIFGRTFTNAFYTDALRLILLKTFHD